MIRCPDAGSSAVYGFEISEARRVVMSGTYLDLGFLHCEGSNVSRPQETVGTRLMILPMLMDDSKVINRASSQDFREVIVLDSYRAIGIIGSAG